MTHGDGGMPAAASLCRSIGKVPVGIAFRANAAVGYALGLKPSGDEIAGHRPRKADMALPFHDRSAELGCELLGHFDADFEALASDMRPDVGVELRGVFTRLRGEFEGCLGGDMGDCAPPSPVPDGECAAWRDDDERKAVGEVEQRRDIGRYHDERIRAFRSLVLHLIGIPLAHAHDVRAMHLVGDDELGIGRAEGVEHDLTVARDGSWVVFDMRPAIQRRVRAFAHPALAVGERNAHIASFV